ncbi:MAG: hypothetical protein AAGA54_14970 [Myxococcota bacterium]
MTHDEARPHSLGLPETHETWLLLARLNKALLTRRFPDWSEQVQRSQEATG